MYWPGYRAVAIDNFITVIRTKGPFVPASGFCTGQFMRSTNNPVSRSVSLANFASQPHKKTRNSDKR